MNGGSRSGDVPEAGAMSIPVLALLLVIVDGDEGNAGLDETTGEQEILAAELPALPSPPPPPLYAACSVIAIAFASAIAFLR